MIDESELEPGAFYWARPAFDVDFVPPGFDADDMSDACHEAKWAYWTNKEQPAIYLGDDKWAWLGSENEDWPAIWVGDKIEAPR